MPFTKENPGIDDITALNPKPFTPHQDPEPFPPPPHSYDVPRSVNTSKTTDLIPGPTPPPSDPLAPPSPSDIYPDVNYNTSLLEKLKKWLSVPINFLIVLNMIILLIFLLSPE